MGHLKVAPRRHIALLLMLFAATRVELGAHHSFAGVYDQSKPRTTSTVQNGDMIVVDGFRARDGSQQAAAVSITTRTGQRMRAVRPFR